MSDRAEPLEVYGFWRSQAMYRLRVALKLKGVAYRETPVNIDKGEQDEPAFRRISPMGSVPALIADGTALTQSLAILEWLEETYPEPALLPRDPLGRARVRSIASIVVADSHPLIVPRVKRYLAEHAGFDAARWKAWQTHFFTAGLQGIEARLAADGGTGRFCHGDAPTIADICLAGLAAGARTFDIAVADVPTVDRIVDGCLALPAFIESRADRQSDYPG